MSCKTIHGEGCKPSPCRIIGIPINLRSVLTGQMSECLKSYLCQFTTGEQPLTIISVCTEYTELI